MRFLSWLRELTPSSAPAPAGRNPRRSPRRKPLTARLHLEQLEDRWCPASYSITDLGILDGVGTGSVAWAINSSGQVAGASGHAFLWTPSATDGVPTNPQMRDLGTLPGFSFSGASALNDAGQVVGYAQAANNSSMRDAFYWNGTVMEDLGTLGGTYTDARGINNAVANVHPVQVVGQSRTVLGEGHAFLWQSGVMTDLNAMIPAGSGWILGTAQAINDNQQIVGWGPHNGETHGFLWQLGSSAAPTDLGAFAGDGDSVARAVNKAGQVAGESGFGHHPFLSTNGTMTALPLLHGTSSGAYNRAVAVNNASQVQVVGQSFDVNATVIARALLWQNGNVIDLTKQITPNAGWSQLEASNGVNDAGRIVGFGTLASGANHAFLLKPATGGKNLTAALTAASPIAQTLTQAQVAPLLTEAIARWAAAGVAINSLHGVHEQITNLPDNILGEAKGTTIYLDANAAGWGWFVDPTPADDSEFTTPGDQGEQTRMDLLTVLEHELGHVLGYDHDADANNVMYETLAAGTRCTPAAGALDGYFAASEDADALALTILLGAESSNKR